MTTKKSSELGEIKKGSFYEIAWSNRDNFLVIEFLSSIKGTLYFGDSYAARFHTSCNASLLPSRLPPSQEERDMSGARQIATKLFLLAEMHLFLLNKHFMDCWKPWVSSKVLKRLILTIFVSILTAFMEE